MKPLLTLFAVTLLAAPAFTQDAPKPETEKRIADLERKLDILTNELEAQKTGSLVSVAKGEGKYGLAPAASKVYETKGGLSIGGYGEMVYENFDSKLENGTYSPKSNGLDFARQILYLGFKFNERIVFNAEIEFEHAKTSGAQVVAKTGANVTDVKQKEPGEVAVEFAYLDFLLTKTFNLRAGMMLVPMGFINEMHEPPTFLGAKRPFVEQQLIPSTWRENGVGVHGELPANLSYRLYLVNGLDASRFTKSGIRGGRQNGAATLAESLAWTGRLDWNPIPGAVLGISFYHGNSQQADNLPSLTTKLFDLHGEYRFQGFQVRALVVRGSHNSNGLSALASTNPTRQLGTEQKGHYLEVGYDVLGLVGSKQALIPFMRSETLNPQAEAVAGVTLDMALDQKVLTYGAVYKPIPQVAVKADVNRIRNGAGTGRNQFNLGIGYYF